MPTSTVENYLKTLYIQEMSLETGVVQTGRLAEAMGVTPGTATSMVKALSDAGLIKYEPRVGVRLTDRGQTLALQVLRRHRLIELFLVEVVGLDWSEVHDEAEELEHAISDKVLERIDILLGRPDTDPHGDPIPPQRGELTHDAGLVPLPQVEPGRTVTLVRVLDQQPNFLQYAELHGLMPGQQITIQAYDAIADAVTCQAQNKPPVTLGSVAANKFLTRSEATDS